MSIYSQGFVITDLAPNHLDDVCKLEYKVNGHVCLSRRQSRTALHIQGQTRLSDGIQTYFGGLIAYPSNPATLQPLGDADAYAFWILQSNVLHIHRIALTGRATQNHFDAKFVELILQHTSGDVPITCWTTAEQGPNHRPYTPPADLLEGFGFHRLFDVEQAFELQAGSFWWNPQESGLTAKSARRKFENHPGVQ